MVPFFQRGTVSEQKKVKNSTPLKRGTILVPLGHHFSTLRGTFFLNNHVYETVALGYWGTEIVPLRVPYYGQSNSAARGIISVPFFFWVREIRCGGVSNCMHFDYVSFSGYFPHRVFSDFHLTALQSSLLLTLFGAVLFLVCPLVAFLLRKCKSNVIHVMNTCAVCVSAVIILVSQYLNSMLLQGCFVFILAASFGKHINIHECHINQHLKSAL